MKYPVFRSKEGVEQIAGDGSADQLSEQLRRQYVCQRGDGNNVVQRDGSCTGSISGHRQHQLQRHELHLAQHRGTDNAMRVQEPRDEVLQVREGVEVTGEHLPVQRRTAVRHLREGGPRRDFPAGGTERHLGLQRQTQQAMHQSLANHQSYQVYNHKLWKNCLFEKYNLFKSFKAYSSIWIWGEHWFGGWGLLCHWRSRNEKVFLEETEHIVDVCGEWRWHMTFWRTLLSIVFVAGDRVYWRRSWATRMPRRVKALWEIFVRSITCWRRGRASETWALVRPRCHLGKRRNPLE